MQKDYNQLLLLKNNFQSGTPATENDIAQAEQELGINFSSEYIEYLKEFGSVSYFGHILTGISPYPGINIVIVTKEEHKNNPMVEKDYYVIEQAHIDGIVIWQNYSGDIFKTSPGGQPILIFSSLKEYIMAT